MPLRALHDIAAQVNCPHRKRRAIKVRGATWRHDSVNPVGGFDVCPGDWRDGMKIKRLRPVIEFAIETDAQQFNVRFFPVDGTPGFTHKVVISGNKVGWLSTGFKPSKHTAKWFFTQWVEKELAEKACGMRD